MHDPNGGPNDKSRNFDIKSNHVCLNRTVAALVHQLYDSMCNLSCCHINAHLSNEKIQAQHNSVQAGRMVSDKTSRE